MLRGTALLDLLLGQLSLTACTIHFPLLNSPEHGWQEGRSSEAPQPTAYTPQEEAELRRFSNYLLPLLAGAPRQTLLSSGKTPVTYEAQPSAQLGVAPARIRQPSRLLILLEVGITDERTAPRNGGTPGNRREPR